MTAQHPLPFATLSSSHYSPYIGTGDSVSPSSSGLDQVEQYGAPELASLSNASLYSKNMFQSTTTQLSSATLKNSSSTKHASNDSLSAPFRKAFSSHSSASRTTHASALTRENVHSQDAAYFEGKSL